MGTKITITIETWNEKWRYEVDVEGEIVAHNVVDTYPQCCDRVKEIIEDEEAWLEVKGGTVL